jgi:IS30 family transposase
MSALAATVWRGSGAAGRPISVYFADPYATWQRGANENSNGLLRQYLPKGIDMSKISDATLADAIDRINNRPRKCLGYRTPCEILQDKISGALGCGI